jgi:hypothetical protein
MPERLDAARLARRRRELALDHAAGRVDDETYLASVHALRTTAPDVIRNETTKVSAIRAVEYLRDLATLWPQATESERSELLHAIYARVTVTRDGFDSVELTPHADAHGVALAMPETVLASPAGAGAAHGRGRSHRPVPGRGAPAVSPSDAGAPIASLARVIRSKNAGPFQFTVDFLFVDRDSYERVVRAEVVTREVVAELYGLPLERVRGVYFWSSALALKVTIDREVSAGAPGDSDCYGAQQHAPLLAIRVPETPVSAFIDPSTD